MSLSVLAWAHLLSGILAWTSWVLIACAGVCGAVDQGRVVTSALLALPITLIPFVHGLINFAFGIGGRPTYWSRTDKTHAFSDFLTASAIFSVLGLLMAGCAALATRALIRARRSRGATRRRRHRH